MGRLGLARLISQPSKWGLFPSCFLCSQKHICEINLLFFKLLARLSLRLGSEPGRCLCTFSSSCGPLKHQEEGLSQPKGGERRKWIIQLVLQTKARETPYWSTISVVACVSCYFVSCFSKHFFFFVLSHWILLTVRCDMRESSFVTIRQKRKQSRGVSGSGALGS